LVLAGERRRKTNVLDQLLLGEFLRRRARAAQRVDDRGGDLVEGSRPAGAAVEDARHVAALQHPQVDADRVVDVDEVAALLAIAIAARADEKLDPALGA